MLGAFCGSGGGVDPAADRRSWTRCAFPAGHRAAGRYRQAYGRRPIAPAGAGARVGAQSRWGKSARPAYRRDMGQSAEIFGTAASGGTGVDVRASQRNGVLELTPRPARGGTWPAPRPTEGYGQRNERARRERRFGGMNRPLVRQPVALATVVRSHNPALLVRKGCGVASCRGWQVNRPGLAGLNRKESDG